MVEKNKLKKRKEKMKKLFKEMRTQIEITEEIKAFARIALIKLMELRASTDKIDIINKTIEIEWKMKEILERI